MLNRHCVNWRETCRAKRESKFRDNSNVRLKQLLDFSFFSFLKTDLFTFLTFQLFPSLFLIFLTDKLFSFWQLINLTYSFSKKPFLFLTNLFLFYSSSRINSFPFDKLFLSKFFFTNQLFSSWQTYFLLFLFTYKLFSIWQTISF